MNWQIGVVVLFWYALSSLAAERRLTGKVLNHRFRRMWILSQSWIYGPAVYLCRGTGGSAELTGGS